MNQEELTLHLVSEEEDNLRKLHYWLAYEISSIGLGGLAFFVPVGPVLLLLKWAAIIFTPYMLWRLFKARRFGWIVGFMVTVVLPFLVGLFVVKDGMASTVFISLIPLATFYVYTSFLRIVVGEWIENLRWINHPLDKGYHRMV